MLDTPPSGMDRKVEAEYLTHKTSLIDVCRIASAKGPPNPRAQPEWEPWTLEQRALTIESFSLRARLRQTKVGLGFRV